MHLLIRTLLSSVFIVLFSLQIRAQSYDEKLTLIDSLRHFISQEIQLQISDSFYMKWKSENSERMYYFLYASKPDTICSALVGGKDFLYFSNEDSAIYYRMKLSDSGFHCLLYKTAGTSGAQLNKRLLSYPPEAIVFIVLHEATHQHVHSFSEKIPYVYEEALCDAMANFYGVKFFRQRFEVYERPFRNQLKRFEKLYSFLNLQTALLRADGKKAQSKVFRRSGIMVKRVAGKGNNFEKDRMIYDVNNAYFVRIVPYAQNYFLLKRELEKEKLETILKKIRRGDY